MKKIKFIIFPLFILFIYLFINYYFKSFSLSLGEKKLNKLFSNYHFVTKKEDITIDNLYLLGNISLKNPITIIDKVFAYNQDEMVFSYTENISKPKIYIYSTHPNEKYLTGGVEGYNISLNIVEASKMLANELEKRGVDVVVEGKRSDEYIAKYNLPFKDSYLATREFLTEQLKVNNYDLIIDLHRDSTSKDITTANINGENYAKIMFVMNVNYKNKNLASKLNGILKSKYEDITRGIYNKYVDSFNQDLNEKVMLIELGGDKNTATEVVNSITVLADSIKELLYEG